MPIEQIEAIVTLRGRTRSYLPLLAAFTKFKTAFSNSISVTEPLYMFNVNSLFGSLFALFAKAVFSTFLGAESIFQATTLNTPSIRYQMRSRGKIRVRIWKKEE